MKLELIQGLRLQQKLSPKMQQAIKLLQLSALELEDEIEQLLDTNPVLERVEQKRQINDYPLESIAAPAATLRDYLYWQMNLTPFSALDQQIALNIIDGIDEDGYLTVTLSDIKNSLPDASTEEITAVLHRIQQFDPCGVASRDLQECLMLQNKDPLCAEIISKHMDLLAKHQYRQIKKCMGLTDQQLENVINNIMQLHPRPGSKFCNVEKCEYIIPDIIVRNINDKLQVKLNPELQVKLKINDGYAQHMQNQFQEAKWLLNSLQIRDATLLAVSKWIVKYQTNFFASGEKQMLPLKMSDIARDLGLHESTISRICSNKYMHTPRGTLGLKYFFSTEVNTDCSAIAIKAIIKELITNEQANKPYSDEEIRHQMAAQGIKIARRTISKYREAMGIQTSSQRKTTTL